MIDMTNLFIRILNMSISASWIVLIVIVLRLFLKKAPKGIVCVLWAIVALRLLIPVLPESAFSLMPGEDAIPQKVVTFYEPQHGGEVGPVVSEKPVDNGDRLLKIMAPIWLLGIAAMLGYSAVIYLILRKRVSASIPMEKRVFLCDSVDSPFVFGVFSPKIYIPSGIEESRLQYILAHEKAHIQRRDHWWKPFGFVLLSIHWFNPILWIAYILLCRDIEQACDEKVVAGLDMEDKIGYSQALVACSVHRRMILVCPVAFGEVGVKTRVKGVLSYKRPAFWIILASVLLCAVVAVCFLTNPETCIHLYKGKIVTAATCTQEGVEEKSCIFCQHSYTVPVAVCAHTYDDGAVVKSATCIQEGVLERHCTGCTAVKMESIAKAAHICGAFTVTKEPTCAEEGEQRAFCTVCQVLCAAKPVAKNQEHILEETVVRKSTCSAPGEGLRTCTRCAYSETVAYELMAHDFQHFGTDHSTCIHYGEIIQVCSRCNAVNTVRLTELGDHSWTYNPGAIEFCSYCNATRPSKDPSPFDRDGYDMLESSSIGDKPSIPVFPVVKWDIADDMRPKP